ncbi:MAG: hypothetical protein II902_00700 [Selenomonadaceae bacterium]|nr:hypothetical protein [Selenomonadaceae bacterium]
MSREIFLRVSRSKSFVMKTSQEYSKIFVRARSEDGNLNVQFEVAEIDCKDEKNILAASEKFIREENLVESLGCRELERLLDKFILRENNSVGIKKLWEYFSTYYYLSRPAEEKVLLEAVSKGVEEDFRDGEYLELHFEDVVCKNISAKNFLLTAQATQELLNIKDPPPEIFFR